MQGGKIIGGKQDGFTKTVRILKLFEQFRSGQAVNKKQAASSLQVSEKAIQRDIEDLRSYLSEMYMGSDKASIVYNAASKAYQLEIDNGLDLTEAEIFAIIKVLLESRAFPKKEIELLIDKLLEFSQAGNRKHIEKMVDNEEHLYEPLQHNELLFQKMWELSLAIRQMKKLWMTYCRVGASEHKTRIVEPVGLIFSEYYFYLIAYIEGKPKDFPTIFRLDRIKEYKTLDTHFHIPDLERFQEGEFRKQVQFMQTGKLITVKFRFWGESLEAVKDRFPNAVVKEDGDSWLIVTKVFGRGIKMWLLSQGPYIEVLEPKEFRDEMQENLKRMLQIYSDNSVTQLV